VTISFWFRSNIPSGSQTNFVLRNGNSGGTNWNINQPFTYNTTGTWQYVTSTVQPPPNGSGWNTGSSTGIEMLLSPVFTQNCSNVAIWQAVNQIGLPGSYIWPQNAGNFIEFTGVQLEKGTVATPWEQRPDATELALCQRYLFQLSPQDTAPCYQRTSVLGLYTIRFPVTMRTGVNPTISGGFNVSLGSTDTTQTSLTTPGGAYQPSAAGSQYNFPSAQTIGLAGHITINASGYIRYDAEI
jgi:hypothetical protein